MILSDRTIREQIDAGRIGVDPLGPNAIQPSSVDVRLDGSFRVFLNHTRTVIDVKEDLSDLTQRVDIGDDDAFILHPGEFVLASTREVVTLPDDIVARIEGKSSLARLGLLIHSSLPGSEPVYVRDEAGGFRACPIEEVVRKQLRAHVIAFDPQTFDVDFQPVTGWYEGPPDRIYEIVLASGRRVRVTAGHNVFTLGEQGAIEKVRTRDLASGVEIAVPRRLPTSPESESERTVRIAIADVVPDSCPLALTVTGPTIQALFDSRHDDVLAALEDAGLGSTAFHYRRHSRLPFVVARQLGAATRLTPTDRFGWRGGTSSVPAVIEVGNDVAWTMGTCVAEGRLQRTQVVISSTDQAELDRVRHTCDALGVPVSRSDGAVTICSTVVASLLDWIGTGGTAPTKRVPPMVFSWPPHLVEAFLDGLVDGEGSFDGGPTSVAPASDGLVGDLLLLCGLLGRQTVSGDTPGDTVMSDRLVDGDLAWDRVVEVRDTGSIETIYDLEVRPGGRKIENFLAGHGGVFVSNTAGFIDPGFSGHITLELANVATLPITLYPGMKIGQISFMRMTTPADVPYGSPELGSKYHGQRGPTPSRYFENFDQDRAAD